MSKRLYFIFLFMFFGCYGLQFPKSDEDPNDPNHGPILLSAGELEYPYDGKVKLEGFVDVELIIDTVGVVIDARVLLRKFNAGAVLTASGKWLEIKDIVDAPIIGFYRHCKYIPALKNGRPIECTVRTRMNYELIK